MDERQILYIAYLVIAAIIFTTLGLFANNAVDIRAFEREYLSKNIALLEDAIIIGNGEVYVYYKLDEDYADRFDISFRKDCEVVVQTDELEGADTFYCGLSEDVSLIEYTKDKIKDLIIFKKEDKLKFDKK